jgi:hypothetical protein
MRRAIVFQVGFCVIGACAAASVSSAQTVATPPTTLAPLAGRFYAPQIGQTNIGFYGTDLGLTVTVGTQLRILFGDSWANTSGTPMTSPAGSSVDLADDAQGWIDLNLLPNGNAVDAYEAAHAPAPGDYPWHAAGPPITFQLNPLLTADPMTVYDGGVTGAALNMGLNRTPEAVFNNGAAVAFALFQRGVIDQCSSASCAAPYVCDALMGVCSNTVNQPDNAIPCQMGQPAPAVCGSGVTCVASTGGGVCEDPTSSMNDGTPAGHQLSIAYQQRVANADLVIPEHWYSQVWTTNKFANATARAVNSFVPSNPGLADYTPANGLNPVASKVFLWGRPAYVGALSQGRDAELYFAYVSIPLYSATGSFAWAPQYFTGTDASGNPQFSPDPSTAIPLNLSGLPKASSEAYDIVNQMAVSYVPNMKKWVMFYGGDLYPSLLSLFGGPNGPFVQHAPDLAIHARFATNPWGPWSAPQQVFAPGNPAAPAAGTAYAPLGPIYDSTCTPVSSPPCVPTEVAWQSSFQYGFLYGANIIDPWTEPRGPLNQDADIYWNVSTWDPYETILMRTRITP